GGTVRVGASPVATAGRHLAVPRKQASNVSDGEVGFAVAVETPPRHGLRISPRDDRRAGGWGEAAEAVAQQDRHVAVVTVSDSQVGLAVAVEIPHRHGYRKRPRVDRRNGGREAPPAAEA